MVAIVQRVFCKECRMWERLPFSNIEMMKLIALQMCQGCEFWHKFEILKNDPNAVRINGKHYWIGPEDDPAPPYWRGMGGGKVIVKFEDGRQIMSTNFWYQGVIPQRWRERLPDNAWFVRQA